MDKERMARAFRERLGEASVLTDEPMCRHTSFRIGGPADLFLKPASAEALKEALALVREEGLPCFVMGNGTNLLVSDEGFRGVIIRIGREMSRVEVQGDRIRAESGALLSTIAAAAKEHALTGFEFAGGIPGSLGGACVMNAGAYGGEMKQVLTSVTALDEDLSTRTFTCEELMLSYRRSIFMSRRLIALDAVIRLAPGDPARIEEKSAELREKRQAKQPLDLPSAGSTFKRPEGYFAGKLIMDAGLAGYRVGGAMVSPKHCGFVVNAGEATAVDVMTLIRDVQARVEETSGVRLEMEVLTLGFDRGKDGLLA